MNKELFEALNILEAEKGKLDAVVVLAPTDLHKLIIGVFEVRQIDLNFVFKAFQILHAVVAIGIENYRNGQFYTLKRSQNSVAEV